LEAVRSADLAVESAEEDLDEAEVSQAVDLGEGFPAAAAKGWRSVEEARAREVVAMARAVVAKMGAAKMGAAANWEVVVGSDSVCTRV
jgi:hypothetical protein